MKKIKNKLALLVLCLLLSGCCFLFGEDCDECENVKNGLELADLLLNDFESNRAEDEERGTFFRVAHTILNFASEFECPEEVQTASSHDDQLQLIFFETDDTDFSNPTLVETQNVNVNQSTQPNNEYTIVNEIVFKRDGIYDLESNIDFNDDVVERNENNNRNSNNPAAKGYRPDSENLIYVTKDMLGTGNTDNKENNKFIKEWKISIQ